MHIKGAASSCSCFRLLWLNNSGISFIKKYKSNVLMLNILKLIVTLSYVFVKQSISCIGKTTPCNGHCWNPSYSHICGDNICLNENQLKVWHIFFFFSFSLDKLCFNSSKCKVILVLI